MSLPSDFPYEGQWVIEDKVFLFQADPPGSKGDFAGALQDDGSECDGFDTDLFAKQIGISTAQLLDFNRRGHLRVAMFDLPASPGVDSTTKVEMQTPNEGTVFTFCRASRFGHA